MLIEGLFYGGMSRMAALTPAARPGLHGIRRHRGLWYGKHPAHRLDVYEPVGRAGARPVVMYVHGGAFRAMSKDTHWLMGLIFARRGYLVFNVDYRLAPEFRFPAALEDLSRALAFVRREAPRFGGDPDRLVLAGESAGANLVTALTVASCYRRDEPFARSIFEEDYAPKAVVPFCGILQVSEPDRLLQEPIWFFERDAILSCAELYLPNEVSVSAALADPLKVIESQTPDRPLPPFFVSVGTSDRLLPDSRRLALALEDRAVPHRARYFDREIHAFQALVFRRAARECWRDLFAYLNELGLGA